MLSFFLSTLGLIAAEGNGSLSDSKKEGEPTTADGVDPDSSPEVRSDLQVEGGDVAELGSQLVQLKDTVQTLTEGLAESNAEAELFRRKFSELQLRMEALGLAAADKDRAKLEQRLLAAVSDLQLAQKERDEFRDQMLRLSETVLRYLKGAEGGDAQARMEVETQLRGMSALVEGKKKGAQQNVSLLNGTVVGVKDEWSFIVGNVGAKQGVKIGMPLRVKRGDEVIASLRVVDVRERICGAVIQESGKEKIKVGDRLEVDARHEVSVR